MFSRAKTFIRSEKAVPTASMLMIAAVVIESNLLSVAACSLLLAYLLYWRKHTKSNSHKLACVLFSACLLVLIVVNIAIFLRK